MVFPITIILNKIWPYKKNKNQKDNCQIVVLFESSRMKFIIVLPLKTAYTL